MFLNLSENTSPELPLSSLSLGSCPRIQPLLRRARAASQEPRNSSMISRFRVVVFCADMLKYIMKRRGS
jgi:hypothetical protein